MRKGARSPALHPASKGPLPPAPKEATGWLAFSLSLFCVVPSSSSTSDCQGTHKLSAFPRPAAPGSPVVGGLPTLFLFLLVLALCPSRILLSPHSRPHHCIFFRTLSVPTPTRPIAPRRCVTASTFTPSINRLPVKGRGTRPTDSRSRAIISTLLFSPYLPSCILRKPRHFTHGRRFVTHSRSCGSSPFPLTSHRSQGHSQRIQSPRLSQLTSLASHSHRFCLFLPLQSSWDPAFHHPRHRLSPTNYTFKMLFSGC